MRKKAISPYSSLKFCVIYGVIFSTIITAMLGFCLIKAFLFETRQEAIRETIEENWFMDDRFKK